ncbi:hypothetical protein CYMTET_42113 [Cymbomonas tetramitiformis]|uniref:ABC transmembrane type-1 domain-containing protein n=1 Tax=Cymbomonas tetramitiformis TaxID=36881 RepID=A0AAE0F1Z2_9CHLO|nr:hypothetical protein CYMTET_42113 [Cymbomonas tetramitiformis]
MASRVVHVIPRTSPGVSAGLFKAEDYKEVPVDSSQTSPSAFSPYAQIDEEKPTHQSDNHFVQGNSPTIREVELCHELSVLLPPPRTSLNWFLPGTWKPPYGYGEKSGGSLKGMWWALWWLARSKPWKLAVCLCVIFTEGAVSYLIPRMVSIIFASVCEDEEDCNGIQDEDKRNVGLLGVFFFLRTFLKFELRRNVPDGGQFVPITRAQLVDHINHLSLREAEQKETAKLLSIVQEDINVMNGCISSSVLVLSYSTQLLLTLVVLVTFEAYLLMGLVFGTIPLFVVVLRIFTPLVLAGSDQKTEENRNFMATATDTIEKGTTIRLLNLNGFANGRIKIAGIKLQKTFGALKRATLNSAQSIDYLKDLAVLSILGGGVILVNNNTITVAVVIAFYGVVETLFQVVTGLIQELRSFQMASPCLHTITLLLSSRAKDFVRASEISSSGRIEVRDLCFDYQSEEPNSSKPKSVLKQCNLTIPDGHKVALVGRSGSGKSTLLKCIARQYMPTSGEVHVSGNALETVDIPKMFSVMEQNRVLFDDTVRFNIGFEEEYSAQHIEEAATKAGVLGRKDTKWVLPNGLDTPCGHHGKNMSLG